LDFEQYVVFTQETSLSLFFAAVSTSLVLIIVTFSWRLTLLVIFSVLLVLVYVSAVIHYWDLTFNSIVVVNIMVAIAFAVDFSVHIVNTFLITVPPKTKAFKSVEKKRAFKTKVAFSRMGSSLFFGGFATLLAVICIF